MEVLASGSILLKNDDKVNKVSCMLAQKSHTFLNLPKEST